MYLIGYGNVDLTPGPTALILDGNLANPNATANTTIGNMSVVGGTAPFTWAYTAGNSTYKVGNLTGTSDPLQRSNTGSLTPGNFDPVTVTVTDTNGASFHQDFTVQVATLPTSVNITPSSVLDSAAASTLVGTFNTIGGVSGYTYSAWDNANFTTSGSQLFVSAAGVGNLTAGVPQVGNITSTDAFGNSVTTQKTISVTASVSTGLPTPPTPPTEGFDVVWNLAGDPLVAPVTEGVAGSWKIANATSAFSALNNTTYTKIQTLHNAAVAVGNYTANVGPGMYVVGGITTTAANRTICWNGAGNISAGAGGTYFKVTTGSTNMFVTQDDTWTSVLLVYNQVHGPFQFEIDATKDGNGRSTYQFGQSSLNLKSHKLVCYNNTDVLRFGGNGIQSSDYQGDQQAANAELWVFNANVFCNANLATEHNFYIHNLRRFYCERVFSHTSAGHAFKCDAQRTDLIDCTAAGRYDTSGAVTGNLTSPGVSGWGLNNATLNVTRDVDFWGRNVLIMTDYVTKVSASYISTTRNQTMGTLGAKIPDGYYHPVGSRAIVWRYGGDDDTTPAHGGPLYSTQWSSHSVALANGTVNAGNTTAVFKKVGPLKAPAINETFNRTLNDTTPHAYDVELWLDNDSIHRCSATCTAGSSGAMTVTLDAAIPASRSWPTGYPCNIKTNGNSTRGAQNWDQIQLTVETSPRYNPADPNYYWPKIKTAGVLDIAKCNNVDGTGFYTQICEDFMFNPVSSLIGSSKMFNQAADDNLISWTSTSNQTQLPLSPMKSNVGAWADPAGAGSWTGNFSQGSNSLVGSNGNVSGTGIDGSDTCQTNMMLCMDWKLYDQNLSSNFVRDHFAASSAPSTPPFSNGRAQTNMNWINSGGTITQIAQGGTSNPVTLTQFTLTAQANAGNTTLHVSSTSNMVANTTRASVKCFDANNHPFAHAFDITGVNSGNLTVTIDPAVPTWLTMANGAFGCVATKSAGPPAGPISPEDFVSVTP